MGRRKPISGKQRKEQLQEKRAVKRGDIEKPPPAAQTTRRRPIGGRSQAQLRARIRDDDISAINAAAKAESSRKLQSAFRKVSPEFLALWRERASNEVLERPIPSNKRYFDLALVEQKGSNELGTPKRPKWRYEMSKKEVERNEEGMFEKWKKETEEKVERWRLDEGTLDRDPLLGSDSLSEEEMERLVERKKQVLAMRSPTFYEQNLEVWRQLWRVTEISSILLVLLDSRCPPLHYPPSLHAYLSSLKPARKIILVLTKTDIVGLDRAERWKAWLKARYPEVKVVGVESYRVKTGKGSRVKHLPHIPPQYLADLIDAMESCYTELLEPPDTIRADPKKVERWVPHVRKSLDWDVVRKGETGTSSSSVVTVVTAPTSDERGIVEEDEDPEGDANSSPRKEVTEPLTIGLIGQPNVGKSSLLNALFGTTKVKASRTPGKTKHFQTLFWSPEIRLVDCPGLVLPNLVPMELQVLSAILPISQMASIASCIHYASSLIPLEAVFQLRHPSEDEPAEEDKRTWRPGMRTTSALGDKKETPKWTAMDVMTAYANTKGWMTAKAGRPDVNRAGNTILRTLADGRVRWAFEPPMNTGQGHADVAEGVEYGRGIWIKGNEGGEDKVDSSEDEDEDEEQDSVGGGDSNDDASGGPPSGSDDEEDDDEAAESSSGLVGGGRGGIGGMFGALSLVEDTGERSGSDPDE